MHKNSQKRYYGEGIYFLTCNTQDRYPYFKHKILCDLWIEELAICKQFKQFDLYAFCLNYDHFHLLLQPNEDVANISQIMQSLKKNVSQDINKIILDHTEGENSNSRLQRIDIDPYKRRYSETGIEIPKFQRQKSFHDHIVRDAGDYKHHRYYTRDNYLKHNLPSSRSYHSGHTQYEHILNYIHI